MLCSEMKSSIVYKPVGSMVVLSSESSEQDGVSDRWDIPAKISNHNRFNMPAQLNYLLMLNRDGDKQQK
jgi:hypothetical protein